MYVLFVWAPCVCPFSTAGTTPLPSFYSQRIVHQTNRIHQSVTINLTIKRKSIDTVLLRGVVWCGVRCGATLFFWFYFRGRRFA